MAKKKGLIQPYVFGQAQFDFDEELVHPRAWPTYVMEREKAIARLTQDMRAQLDAARIKIRENFNELLRMRGLMPIPDDPERVEGGH